MTKCMPSLLTASMLALAFLADPAQAQPTRVFVAAQGSDTNSCTFALPCRTFQRAHNVVAAGGEIDVLDPAGYGKVVITKAISIQGHGFSGISATLSSDAITINAGATDKTNLRGLLLDALGSGQYGIVLQAGASLNVQDCLIRNFAAGLYLRPSALPANCPCQVRLPASSPDSIGRPMARDRRAAGARNVSGRERERARDRESSADRDRDQAGAEIASSAWKPHECWVCAVCAARV